jgi:hypothetical protein
MSENIHSGTRVKSRIEEAMGIVSAGKGGEVSRGLTGMN